MTRSTLREFLEIPYDRLEEMNLEAKKDRFDRDRTEQIIEQRRAYLNDEKRIKALTVAFTDLEGRLHMLDYDKKFLLGARTIDATTCDDKRPLCAGNKLQQFIEFVSGCH